MEEQKKRKRRHRRLTGEEIDMFRDRASERRKHRELISGDRQIDGD